MALAACGSDGGDESASDNAADNATGGDESGAPSNDPAPATPTETPDPGATTSESEPGTPTDDPDSAMPNDEPDPNDGNEPCKGSAEYEISFVGTWSPETHPEGFPPGPHFSRLIGAVHDDSFDMWTAIKVI